MGSDLPKHDIGTGSLRKRRAGRSQGLFHHPVQPERGAPAQGPGAENLGQGRHHPAEPAGADRLSDLGGIRGGRCPSARRARGDPVDLGIGGLQPPLLAAAHPLGPARGSQGGVAAGGEFLRALRPLPAAGAGYRREVHHRRAYAYAAENPGAPAQGRPDPEEQGARN